MVGNPRPRCVVAPVADDGGGLGRHKPPPVGMRCKSRCEREIQTPLPRWTCHTSTARPLLATLAKGEHSAEPAFPSAFPLVRPSGGADQGGEMLVGMRQDMAVHLSRPPRQGIGGHGRRCGVEHAIPVSPPHAVQDPKSRCAEHGGRALEPKVGDDCGVR